VRNPKARIREWATMGSGMTPLSTVAYDANGNTLTDAQGRSFTWDFENRLTQAVVPGTNGGTTNFKYDPFGRRIQKSGPLGTTNYLYDGLDLIEEADSSSNVLARYTEGLGVDHALSMLRAGTTVYYQQDGIASVTSLSNSSSSLANTYTYDSFGCSPAQFAQSPGACTGPQGQDDPDPYMRRPDPPNPNKCNKGDQPPDEPPDPPIDYSIPPIVSEGRCEAWELADAWALGFGLAAEGFLGPFLVLHYTSSKDSRYGNIMNFALLSLRHQKTRMLKEKRCLRP
jgi:hypothetical protein